MWVSEIRGASFTLSYEVYDLIEGERLVHLRASSRMAPFIFETESPRRITEQERELLREFLEETPARDSLPGTKGQVMVTPLRLRFTDLDVFQHANNVQYFEFFQEARIQFMMSLHSPDESWANHVVARTDIEYRKPMHYRRAPYDVHNWTSRVGTRSFTVSAEIRNGEDVLATSRVVMVTFDDASQKSMPMPADQRRALLTSLG